MARSEVASSELGLADGSALPIGHGPPRQVRREIFFKTRTGRSAEPKHRKILDGFIAAKGGLERKLYF